MGLERREPPLFSAALVGYLAAVLAVVLLLVALPSGSPSADSGAPIGRAELGGDWPLEVSKGLLRCEGDSNVTFQAGGTTYSLGHPAAGSTYSYIGPLVLDAGGTRKDIGPLLERGLRLCRT